MPDKDFMAKRDEIVAELVALEKKHGQEITLSAMRKRVTFVKEESKRMKGIAKLEGELEELRGKIERERGKKR